MKDLIDYIVEAIRQEEERYKEAKDQSDKVLIEFSVTKILMLESILTVSRNSQERIVKELEKASYVSDLALRYHDDSEKKIELDNAISIVKGEEEEKKA